MFLSLVDPVTPEMVGMYPWLYGNFRLRLRMRKNQLLPKMQLLQQGTAREVM
jgi:hypothetical protein